MSTMLIARIDYLSDDLCRLIYQWYFTYTHAIIKTIDSTVIWPEDSDNKRVQFAWTNVPVGTGWGVLKMNLDRSNIH